MHYFQFTRRWNLRNSRSQRDKDYRKRLLEEILTEEDKYILELYEEVKKLHNMKESDKIGV